MPQLFYLAVGFLGGYLLGRRHGIVKVLHREATSLLDSVGRMPNLHALENLHLRSGSARDGVQVQLKTRDQGSLGQLGQLPYDFSEYP